MINIAAVDDLTSDKAKEILKKIFKDSTEPAFGVLPARERDIKLFEALRAAGVVSRDASLYELMSQLKITRAKARNLLFEVDMREATNAEANLDRRAKDALSNPRGFVRDGGYLVFGVENPVVQAHVKEQVNKLGHITDASFDTALIRIKPDALPVLIEALMSEDEKAQFNEAMIDAGLSKDKSLQSALSGSLKFMSTKYLGEDVTDIAAGYLDDLTKLMMPPAQKAKGAITDLLKQAFKKEDVKEPRIKSL